MRPGFHACRSLALTTTSPPRRGSSGGLPVADQHRRVVPAHAGVIRGSTFSAQHCWVVPAQAASSVGQRYPHPDLVVPAQARVIRSRPARSGRWIRRPHACRGHPEHWARDKVLHLIVPCKRGGYPRTNIRDGRVSRPSPPRRGSAGYQPPRRRRRPVVPLGQGHPDRQWPGIR